jgi:hypothetical protein
MEESVIFDLRRVYWNLDGKRGYTISQDAVRDHSDERRDSKVGEYAASECAVSNAFNVIVETNRTSERKMEGISTNPPD